MTESDEPLFDHIVNTDPSPQGYLERSAVLSRELDERTGTARYRYVLERIWDRDRPLALWVMLNPSTADALVDDPTIGRVVSFSRFYGMGAARVINLYALRATDPNELYAAHMAGVDVIGPQNDELIVGDLAGMNGRAGLVIVGWGAKAAPMIAEREAFIREHYYGAWCLGRNQNGSPKHPLYLPGATALDAW